MSNKIDVHAHYLPDSYRAALLAAGHDRPDGFPQVPAWSAQEHVDHLHYGSDYPFTPEFAAAMAAERLAAAGEPPGSLTEALRTNTKRLFHR